jgi:hypothetical protein
LACVQANRQGIVKDGVTLWKRQTNTYLLVKNNYTGHCIGKGCYCFFNLIPNTQIQPDSLETPPIFKYRHHFTSLAALPQNAGHCKKCAQEKPGSDNSTQRKGWETRRHWNQDPR